LLKQQQKKKTPLKEPVPDHHTSFVEVSSTTTDTTTARRMGIRGDLTVQGSVTASVITSPVGNVKASGGVNVMTQVSSASTRTAALISNQGTSVLNAIVSKQNQYY